MSTAVERDPLIPKRYKNDLEDDNQRHEKERRQTVTESMLKGSTVSTPDVAEFGSEKSDESVDNGRFPTEKGGLTSSTSLQARSLFAKVLYSGVPLKILASIFGFWPNIKGKWQFLIFAFVTIIGCGTFTLAAYTCSSCYVAMDLANYTCGIYGKNEKGSRGLLVVILDSSLCLLAPFAVLVSYLMFFYYVLKSVRKEGVLSLTAAYHKTNDSQWLAINVQILATLIAPLPFTKDFYESARHHSIVPRALQVCLLFSELNISVVGWLFAMVTCSLINKVNSCYEAIRVHNEGNIDDVIDLHQNLCDDVFSTCRALQPWFVSHWTFFGLLTAGFFFLAVFDFKNSPYLFFSVTKLLYLFLMPCFYAARVTAKCRDALRELNYIRARDLGVTHPLRSRASLNDFLFYALQVRCGFRVFSFNFGESFAWMSLVFGILASVANLLVYHVL